MRSTSVSILLTGDLVLDEPDAGHWLSGIAPALRAADLAIGHLEVPHTRRGSELAGDVPAPGAPPENLAALAAAGFGAVSLAGNHIADCGAEGIEDTRAGLTASGVAFAGAGCDLAAAGAPAVVVVDGTTVALLSYNCVGPEGGWATPERAGANYLRVDTADGAAITPSAELATVAPEAFARLAADIAAVRDRADIVIVALHKGIVHTPVRLAPYERPLAQAAIDAGADAVAGHHAHIVKGIELYRGRAIFHGLGNGCVVTRALSPDQEHPKRREWAERRKTLFGFEPNPAYVLAPFHPEAVNAFIGRVERRADGSITNGIVAVHVEAPGRPVLAAPNKAREIADYVERITVEAGLPAIRITDNGEVLAA